MTDPSQHLDQARHHFEAARRDASLGDFNRASARYQEAASAASAVWRAEAVDGESRSMAARLAADAMYAAGMAAARGLDGGVSGALREATLHGLTIYETESLEPGVRAHGLYRAQCAAFELGHVLTEHDPVEAVALFRDAAGCVQAVGGLELHETADEQCAARVLANAAAAHVALASLLRSMQDSSFKDHYTEAITCGKDAIESGALPGGLEVETMLVLADAAYELGLSTERREDAIVAFEDALGWTRVASEAPGADGGLQAQALLKGANIACVYGLYVRHDDLQRGIEALEGAIALARTAAEADHLPIDFRAQALDTAVRTQQNIALLEREGSPSRALESFGRAAGMAREAASLPNLPPPVRANMLYLAANATLEVAILTQQLAGTERLAGALEGFMTVQELVREVLGLPHAQPDVVARAALLGCGASGRLLRALDPAEDEAAIQTELETIELFGQRAAQTQGADLELRARAAFFAADAAEKLASRLTHPAAVAEARQRAQVLTSLQRGLEAARRGH